MVRTFLKVYMELGSSFLFLQEQIKDIIIGRPLCAFEAPVGPTSPNLAVLTLRQERRLKIEIPPRRC